MNYLILLFIYKDPFITVKEMDEGNGEDVDTTGKVAQAIATIY